MQKRLFVPNSLCSVAAIPCKTQPRLCCPLCFVPPKHRHPEADLRVGKARRRVYQGSRESLRRLRLAQHERPVHKRRLLSRSRVPTSVWRTHAALPGRCCFCGSECRTSSSSRSCHPHIRCRVGDLLPAPVREGFLALVSICSMMQLRCSRHRGLLLVLQSGCEVCTSCRAPCGQCEPTRINRAMNMHPPRFVAGLPSLRSLELVRCLQLGCTG